MLRNEIAVSFGRTDAEQLGDIPAAGLSYNHFWTHMISTRFGAFAGTGEDTSIGAVHASAEAHFRREQRVSPYAGAGVAYAFTERGRKETVIAPIFEAGVDVRLSPRFSVGLDARYLFYHSELEDRFGYDLHPLTVLASAKFRY